MSQFYWPFAQPSPSGAGFGVFQGRLCFSRTVTALGKAVGPDVRERVNDCGAWEEEESGGDEPLQNHGASWGEGRSEGVMGTKRAGAEEDTIILPKVSK